MKLLNFLLVLGLLFSAACSNNKKQGEGGGDEVAAADKDEDYVEYILDDEKGDDKSMSDGAEVADGGDGDGEEYYVDDEEDAGDEEVADAGDEQSGDEAVASDELAAAPEGPATKTEEIALDEETPSKEEAPIVADSGSSNVEVGDEAGSYQVKSNETLMMVAFKLYGDYTMWRKLQQYNSLSGMSISSGQALKYQQPVKKFVWNPEGLPYLIQRGDTLGTISNDKYGTPSKWKSLWDNNRPLIKNPNLIFAGFTLYYISNEDRDVASEQ